MKNLAILMMCIIILSCKNDQVNDQMKDQIIGKWESEYDSDNYVEFTKSGIYNWFVDGKHISEISNFDSLNYEITDNKQVSELTILDKNKELFSKSIIQIENNQLVSVGFKQGKNINHHIDEYVVTYRKGRPRKSIINNENIKFIFPKNYIGASLIIYGESDGKKPEYDENGNKVYSIPQSGILKINSEVGTDPFKIAKGEIEFFFQDRSENSKQVEIMDPLSNVNKNQIAAKIEGYNQIARQKMYEIFNFHTNNNILFLTIDSIKNLNNTKFYENFEKTFKSN